MPRDVVYFADCGADNSDELDKIKGELYNSSPDQEYGEDEKTGKRWGYSADADAGHSGNKNMFYSVRYDYSQGGEESIGKGITYSYMIKSENSGLYLTYAGGALTQEEAGYNEYKNWILEVKR